MCSGLEPGRDGVGDYTRLLAGELAKMGIQCLMLSVNDGYINDIFSLLISENDGRDAGVSYPVSEVRLPGCGYPGSNLVSAKQILSLFKPDVVSIQFTPYGLSKRGVPNELLMFLKGIRSSKCTLHTMLHELWIGIQRGSGLKHRIIGQFQKRVVSGICNSLADVVHTHSSTYRSVLKQIGIEALELPLFGTIPLLKALHPHSESHLEALRFALFGGIQQTSMSSFFIKDLQRLQKVYGTSVKIAFIGKQGREKQNWIAQCQDCDIRFVDYGELDASKVSEVLLHSTHGITTTPYSLVEKSSAVAAMKEHHLPVWVVREEWIPRSYLPSTRHMGITQYIRGTIKELLEHPSTGRVDSLSKVALKFLNDCKNSRSR